MAHSSIYHMLIVLCLLFWKVQLVSSNFLRNNKKKNVCPSQAEFDVLIIGGGAAGISAALRLKEFNDKIASTNPGTPELKFKLFEASDSIGGRAVAAYFMSGPPKPLAASSEPHNPYTNVWVKDLKQEAVLENETGTKYYDSSGIEHDQAYSSFIDDRMKEAYACLQNEYYAYAKGATTKDDKSLREALRDCGWEDPNPGSLNETIEWSYLDFPLLENVENDGLYNMPLEAPVENVGEGVYYLKKKDLVDAPQRAAASITESLAEGLDSDMIELNARVTEIDIGCQIAQVKVTGHDSNPIEARRVIDTRSIGLRISQPLVTPRTDASIKQLDALQMLYGMGEYITINLQFKREFLDLTDFPLYFTVDNDAGRGRAIFFMNLDYKDYYPGTNALKTFIVTEVYEDLKSNSNRGAIDKNQIEGLLAETLGKVFEMKDFSSCTQILVPPSPEFPQPDPDANLTDVCEWFAFLDENPLWGGAYSFWKDTGLRSKDADRKFEEAWAPLYSDPPKQVFNYFPSGAAYCDCHSEFVHGANWAGTLTANEILEDMNFALYPGSTSGLTKETFEYKACFLSCVSPKKF